MGFFSWLLGVFSVEESDAVSNPNMTSSYDDVFLDSSVDNTFDWSPLSSASEDPGSIFEDDIDTANGLPMFGSIDILDNVSGTDSSYDDISSGIDDTCCCTTIDDTFDTCVDDSFSGMDDDFGCISSFDDDCFGMSISEDW